MKFEDERITPPSINLVPLLDSIFILLFAFMLALINQKSKSGLKLTLPKSNFASPIVDQIITIDIGAKDNLIKLQSKTVSLKELAKELEYLSVESPNQALTVRGDKSVPLGTTIKILDLVKKHGFSNVTIETSRN